MTPLRAELPQPRDLPERRQPVRLRDSGSTDRQRLPKCDYIYAFKPGRPPALWEDFQGLPPLCPDRRAEQTTPAVGPTGLSLDSVACATPTAAGRARTFNAP